MPQYMWDDFIVKHKMQYVQYIQQCAEDFQNPMPYERYYTTMVEAPTFIKGVVTARNLQEGINPSVPTDESSEELIRLESPEIEVSPSFEWPSSHKLLSSHSTPKRKSESFIPTIDLTLDDEPLEMPQRKQPKNNANRPVSSKKERRSLPWVHEASEPPSNNRHAEGGQPQRKRDSLPSRSSLASHTPRAGPSKARVSAIAAESPSQLQGSTLLRQEVLRGRGHDRTRNIQQSHSEAALFRDVDRPLDIELDWWQDRSTPFKQFVHNYTTIQPAKGNSYSSEADKERGKAIQSQRLPSRQKKPQIPVWILE